LYSALQTQYSEQKITVRSLLLPSNKRMLSCSPGLVEANKPALVVFDLEDADAVHLCVCTSAQYSVTGCNSNTDSEQSAYDRAAYSP
jgi:hypothetical protein